MGNVPLERYQALVSVRRRKEVTWWQEVCGQKRAQKREVLHYRVGISISVNCMKKEVLVRG